MKTIEEIYKIVLQCKKEAEIEVWLMQAKEDVKTFAEVDEDDLKRGNLEGMITACDHILREIRLVKI